MNERVTHVVVVGSGIAGLTAALRARENGCAVTVVTKDELAHANTRFAQGGIAGVMFDDDSAQAHRQDTLTAGAGLCDPAAVHVLVDEGPARIRDLIHRGVGFDTDVSGAFVKGLEAAHSYPRILHAGGDATGAEIERALVAAVHGSGARVMEHAFLLDLVTEGGRVRGVRVRVGETDGQPGRDQVIDSDAVIIATGGVGELYAHSTNPAVATGDGIAAALRAGAEVSDLEFVQFHPTVLAAGEPFLVSEAVRGEGATLIDERGERFTLTAHPDAELAPRDVVSRAIADRMTAQGGRPVFLDATAVHSADAEERAAYLATRFPTIDRAVRDRGLDWAREPIPVTPAAHYLMGGISTDLHGRSSLPGLYSVGEAARTGVHGANRLASNSLLEGTVFGARAGDAVVADAANNMASWPVRLSPVTVEPVPTDPEVPVEPFTRSRLQLLMWNYAGLVRNAEGLEYAASVLARWQTSARNAVTEHDLENENLLWVAAALVRAAYARRESVGAHRRSDQIITRQNERALTC